MNSKINIGKKFVIEATNNGPDKLYIQSAKLNGDPYTHNWITHADIVRGGVLDKPFSLSDPK
jgi:putative alpha-1,2-mannosidase